MGAEAGSGRFFPASAEGRKPAGIHFSPAESSRLRPKPALAGEAEQPAVAG